MELRVTDGLSERLTELLSEWRTIRLSRICPHKKNWDIPNISHIRTNYKKKRLFVKEARLLSLVNIYLQMGAYSSTRSLGRSDASHNFWPSLPPEFAFFSLSESRELLQWFFYLRCSVYSLRKAWNAEAQTAIFAVDSHAVAAAKWRLPLSQHIRA